MRFLVGAIPLAADAGAMTFAAAPLRAAEAHARETHPGAPANPNKEAHPRRVSRDRNLAKQTNEDYADLSGRYKQLQAPDANLRKQAQQDMAQNGGHITRAEQQQLNREENPLNARIDQDYKWPRAAVPATMPR